MKALAIWMALWSLGWAQPSVLEVSLRANVPVTEVRLNGQPVNLRGQTISLHRNSFETPGKHQQQPRLLQISAADYQVLEKTVEWNELQQGSYPPSDQPPLQLSLQSPVRYYGWRLSPLLGLLLFLGGVKLWLNKLRQGDPHLPSQLLQRKLDTGDPLIGEEIAGYLLTHRLGEGAFGVVYKALPGRDRRASRAVAVKIFRSMVVPAEADHKMRAQLETEAARIVREVELLRKLPPHPNVVRLWQADLRPERPVLVFEFLEGQPLDQLITGLTDPQRNNIYAQILLGVATLHGHGITHRDLKPANIMVCQTGVVKIIDLGMSRGHDSATLTAKDTARGTPAYLAPEQLNGQPERASDQWAAGIIGYQMWTGSLPFFSPEPFKLYTMIYQQDPPAWPDQAPAAVGAVFRRMLAKNPQDRYPDMQAALHAWQEAVGQNG